MTINNANSDPEADLVLLAVVDAYKWWATSDFGFLQATGILDQNGTRSARKVGVYDVHLVRRIARAYSVSRNIPVDQGDIHARSVADILNSEAAGLVTMPFEKRAELLAALVESRPVRFPDRKGRDAKRDLASAYSKLTWFLRPEDWTIFDRYVGLAVCGSNGVGTRQMRLFYDRLTPNWADLSPRITAVTAMHGFDPLLGYRIIDKWLFLHGMRGAAAGLRADDPVDEHTAFGTVLAARSAFADICRSLRATEQVLHPLVGRRMLELAADLRPLLDRSPWLSTNNTPHGPKTKAKHPESLIVD